MARVIIAAACFLAQTAAQLPIPTSGPWKLFLFDDTDTTGAVCLDGSPAGFYYRWADNSPGADSWIIDLMGGGWCVDPLDCYQRSQGFYGSSAVWPPSTDASFEGLLDANATRNPEFSGWNTVLVPYCSGDSFSGDRIGPLVYNETSLFFRGHRILVSVIDHLSRATGAPGGGPTLRNATNVILHGGSAGGLSTMLHADFVGGLLPKNAYYRAIANCGFFLNAANVWGGAQTTWSYMSVAAMANVSTGSAQQVDAGCFENTPPELRWQCFMAQFTYPHISTPIFLVNSAVDSWQLAHVMAPALPVFPSSVAAGKRTPGVAVEVLAPNTWHSHDGSALIGDVPVDPVYDACIASPANGCNVTQLQQLLGYGVQFMAALNMSVAVDPGAYQRNGAVITSCIVHGQMDPDSLDSIRGRDGTASTIREAVTEWYFGRPLPSGGSHWYFDGPWPGNPTCTGPLAAG